MLYAHTGCQEDVSDVLQEHVKLKLSVCLEGPCLRNQRHYVHAAIIATTTNDNTQAKTIEVRLLRNI